MHEPIFVKPREYVLIHEKSEVENKLVSYAEKHPKQIEVCVARPGYISSPAKVRPQGAPGVGLPSVDNSELVAGLLSQVVNGFEKDPLMNDDLVRIGRQAMQQNMND